MKIFVTELDIKIVVTYVEDATWIISALTRITIVLVSYK
jgi:hypothetical protein